MADRSFTTDTRAIEGLPIRLVIALVVGVAALSMMMTILDGVGEIGQTEITYVVEDHQDLTHSMDDDIDFTMEIVDENGNEITETTVIITSGTAQMDGTELFSTGTDNNEVDVTIDSSNVDLRHGQDTGTLSVDIQPPSDSNHADDDGNPEIIVYR